MRFTLHELGPARLENNPVTGRMETVHDAGRLLAVAEVLDSQAPELEALLSTGHVCAVAQPSAHVPGTVKAPASAAPEPSSADTPEDLAAEPAPAKEGARRRSRRRP